MKKVFTIQRKRLYLWIGLGFAVLGMMTDVARQRDAFWEIVLINFWETAYLVVLNYILFEYTIPRMGWKFFLRSFFLILAHILLYSFGLHAWTLIGIGMHLYSPSLAFPTPSKAAAEQMQTSMASLFFFGIIRHIYNYIKLKQASQQLRIEKQQAELNFLKSQTNPHFLFNTLNNIYSLARDKSDLAPESILRLSKILRYMLYETGGSFIAIEQDLKIISDYIALEKLRYDDSLRINFYYDIEDMKQAFPPLLLIPLVENAFKHGVSETRNDPFIDIHLAVSNRQLTLSIKNSTEEVGEQTRVRENIGLSNLRRQLELLYTDYTLSVQQQGTVFTALLKINLASHV